jgi:hypothetical protein
MAFVSIKDFTLGTAQKLRTFLVNTDENVTVHGLVDSANGEILGVRTDAANTATNGTSISFMSVFKQISASIQALVTALPAMTRASGTSDASTLRVVLSDDSQNENGRAAAADSTPTVLSNEDFAAIGALTETAPASDTASSGLNGRLQRIAQRLTSLIALMGPQTTGGLSTFYDDDLDEAAVAVKAAAGGMFNIVATNRTTAPLYLHFWDVAQGSVTVGTTPVKFTLEIPGNASDHTLAMPNFNPHGVAFGTAITTAVTTALNGTGAPAANACVITIAYK